MKFGEKVSNSIKKRFDSEPLYSEKYLKTKIKNYEGKIKTNFDNDKILKEGSQCIYLSVILTDFVFRIGKNYYPQVLLGECKYVVVENKMPEYITNDMKISSDDSEEENFDKENSNEENFNEKKLSIECVYFIHLLFIFYIT